MWLDLISKARNKAVKLAPIQYLPLRVKITPAIIGAQKPMASALLLCPAAIMIKLYEVKAKAIAPAAASQGFIRNTINRKYAPTRYNKTESTGSGKIVLINEIT